MADKKSIEKELKELGFSVDKDDIVDVKENPDVIADVVYNVKENRIKSVFKAFVSLLPIILIIVAIIFTSSVVTNYSFIPKNVVGASFTVGDLSFVSKEYEFSPSNIKVGSTILYKENNSWETKGFFIKDYEEGIVTSINSMYAFVKQEGTKDRLKVPVGNIMFVLE